MTLDRLREAMSITACRLLLRGGGDGLGLRMITGRMGRLSEGFSFAVTVLECGDGGRWSVILGLGWLLGVPTEGGDEDRAFCASAGAL